MIERAIVRSVAYDRDGLSVLREAPRPEPVLETAQRMHRWRSAPEACSRCRAENAVLLRSGRALCGICVNETVERRDGFTSVLRRDPVRREAVHTGPVFHGYALTFGTVSVDLGGFREMIRPEFVERTFIEKIDVRSLADHDPSKVLGRLSAGTLRMRADRTGLRVEIDAPNTTLSRDLTESVERRDISGQSFAFSTLVDDWALVDDYPMRTLIDGRISEASIVAFPAYPTTTVEVDAAGVLRMRAQRELAGRLRMAQ